MLSFSHYPTIFPTIFPTIIRDKCLILLGKGGVGRIVGKWGLGGAKGEPRVYTFIKNHLPTSSHHCLRLHKKVLFNSKLLVIFGRKNGRKGGRILVGFR
jgi:hypothetical protein